MELRLKYRLTALLKLAEMPRSSYYYYVKQIKKPDKYAVVKEEIQAIYHENHGRYGYRRITIELCNRGYQINHKTVQRLMKVLHLKCMVRIKKYRSYRGEAGKIVPNILKRDFQAEAPNRKWTTDITEFALFGSKLYLSPILDMYNGEIISYEISDRPVLDSDQGWQYQHKTYQKRLKDKGIRQSMSRKGNCLDNAVMENFFGILKSELLYLREFSSMEEFRVELEKYIDYYNNKRIKEKLKGLSPVQYRIQSSLAA